MADISSYAEKTERLVESIAQLKDIPESEAEDLVEEEFQKFFDNKDSELSGDSDTDEQLTRFYAARSVYNEEKNLVSSGFSGGPVEGVPVLTLGYQDKDGDYFVTQDGYKAIVGLGLINPEEDDVNPGLSTFVIDGGHDVDIEYAKELFEPLNTIRAKVTRREVGSRDGENKIRKGNLPTYVCQSTDETTLKEIDPEDEPEGSVFSDLPSTWEEKRDMINSEVLGVDEEVSLQNYSEHVTDRTQSNNGRAFETAFGVDVKRIRGEIVDVFSNDSFGVMTVIDETVYDESDVPEDLVNDQMRNAGLNCFDVAPDLLKYSEGSVVDVYGYIEQTDEGQYRMRPFGIVPLISFDRDTETGASDDSVSEETI